MSSEIETVEGRLTSLLGQLQAECGILDRMVYKNKNQHRRCSYFQYLLKVYHIVILCLYTCLLTNSKCRLGLIQCLGVVNSLICFLVVYKIILEHLQGQLLGKGLRTFIRCIQIFIFRSRIYLFGMLGEEGHETSAVSKLGGACTILYLSCQRRQT